MIPEKINLNLKWIQWNMNHNFAFWFDKPEEPPANVP